MRMSIACRVAFGLSLVVFSASLEARVLSYAPVTEKLATPAIQRRTNRRYLLIEHEAPFSAIRGRLVVHDSQGEEDPRVVRSIGSDPVGLAAVAVREEPDGTLRILALTDARFGGDNPTSSWRWVYSPDGGATWRVLAVPASQSVVGSTWRPDRGGPIARARAAPIQIGDAERPFAFTDSPSRFLAPGVRSVYAVTKDGQTLHLMASGFPLQLVGSDRAGAVHLVAVLGSAGDEVFRIEPSGAIPRLFVVPAGSGVLDGFLTPEGDVYVNLGDADGGTSVGLHRNGSPFTVLARAPWTGQAFAVPTADFAGAWIAKRETGAPTILYAHAPGGSVAEAWRDVSGPEVEALHAGASGNRLLVQVHRPRLIASALRNVPTDPAIAVWEVGQPAPTQYDELYVVESPSKGFVHLDVESVGSGSSFVFDSGFDTTLASGGGQPSSGGSGGGDVTQEWGVVRGSLRQRLVVPAVARAEGAHGTFWRTDLVLQNALAVSQSVSLRFVPSGEGTVAPIVRTLRLDPRELRVEPDLLRGIFGLESGSGALFLTPEGDGAIRATTRTYTSSPEGSYGMGVAAVDVLAAASARFPFTFSAAIRGGGFRSNFVVADTAGRGAAATLSLLCEAGVEGVESGITAPVSGQIQLTGLSSFFGVPASRSGAVIFQPVSGQAVAGVIAIDERTNDPTYFPPDLPASTFRTIPAIVHQDGANGARFRSDLFLVNVTDQARTVLLLAKRWDRNEDEKALGVTLQPRESRTIQDALSAGFGIEGVARLRYQSFPVGVPFASDGVRVTSRTYTVTPEGGTYGLLVPALNALQSGGTGETLEILGPVGGRGFRTNLSLVELTARAGGTPIAVTIEVVNEKGALVDTFVVSLPWAGGLQIDDLFRARGLGDGPTAALLRIKPDMGNVAAYATLLDNGTNDPTYFGASLAAREP